MEVYLQRDQPPGVPPLALDGERTLPDVPEENYWFQRHGAVYQWVAAQVAAKRVIDMATGEGYGADLLAAQAAPGVGAEGTPDPSGHAPRRCAPRRRRRSSESRRTRTPSSTRACATRGRTCASSARWSRSTPSRATRSCS